MITDSGLSFGGRVDLTAKDIKANTKCVHLIHQCGLTHDGGAPAFEAYNAMRYLLHVFIHVHV